MFSYILSFVCHSISILIWVLSFLNFYTSGHGIFKVKKWFKTKDTVNQNGHLGKEGTIIFYLTLCKRKSFGVGSPSIYVLLYLVNE